MQQPTQQLYFQPFKYKIVSKVALEQNNQYNQNLQMTAIKFDNSQVIISQGTVMQIILLNKGQARLIKNIKNHTQIIVKLQFFKKSLILSSSKDQSIIIQSSNLLASPKYLQKSCGHSNSIRCLIINAKQDLIAYGTGEGKIKFYKYDQWILQQTLDAHTQFVNMLCINEKGNKLVSCDSSRLVISEFRNQSLWQPVQQITLYSNEVVGCFINNSLFQILQYKNPLICSEYYEFQNEKFDISCSHQQSLTNRIEQSFQFYSQMSQKQILLNRIGKSVYLFKVEFPFDGVWASHFEQTIDLNQGYTNVIMSDDGKYIIIQREYELEVREYSNEI